MSGYPFERWQTAIAEGFAGQRALDDAGLRGAVEGAVARSEEHTSELSH